MYKVGGQIDVDTRLEMIDMSDIEWYSNIVFEPFFYEYSDYTPNKNKQLNIVKGNLLTTLSSYRCNNILKLDEKYIIWVKGDRAGGVTIMNKPDKSELELAYWILPEYQGKGIASKVMRNVIIKLKEHMKLHKVTLTILENNIASKKLARKLGFMLKNIDNKKEVYEIILI